MSRTAADLEEFIQSWVDDTNSVSGETMMDQVDEYFDRGGSAGDLVEVLRSKMNCAVCMEIPVEGCVTSCKHVFCVYCIETWYFKNKNCPMCRSPYTESPRRFPMLVDVVAGIMWQHDSDFWDCRLQESDEQMAAFYTEFYKVSTADFVKKLKQFGPMFPRDSVVRYAGGLNIRQDIRRLIGDCHKFLKMFPVTVKNQKQVEACFEELYRRYDPIRDEILVQFSSTRRLSNS